MSAATWNDKFELTDGLYSVSDIEDHFEYIVKKRETTTDNSSIRIYRNKKENTINSKTGNYLKFLTSEKMK